MFERFTDRARLVVHELAPEEARGLKHHYIGSEHILLGLLREEEGFAARVLESLDITTERVRGQVVRIVGSGEEVAEGQLPPTPRTKRVLEFALREALSLGHNYIGTEHILLGLVRENEGVAASILLDFDADDEKIRNEVMRILSHPGSSHREPATVFRAPAPKLHFVRLVIHDGSGAGFAQFRDDGLGQRWVFIATKTASRRTPAHNAGDRRLRFLRVLHSSFGWLEVHLSADRRIQTERWRQMLLEEGFVFVPEEA
jgi:hypothetical protein